MGFKIYDIVQGTPEWLALRNGRLTMSNASSAIGTNRFETPEQLADILTGRKQKEFSEKSKILMKRGSDEEDNARQWYQEKYPKRKVSEIGFAIPDWNQKLGCSPDGLVDEDGILEIKHVVEIYYLTSSYYNNKKGKKLIDHIPATHYAQIQGNLGILERKWCDYIVRQFDGPILKIRIPFDDVFWEEKMKPGLNNFVEKYL